MSPSPRVRVMYALLLLISLLTVSSALLSPFDYNHTVFLDLRYGVREFPGYDRKLLGYAMQAHAKGGVSTPAPSPYWTDLGGIEGMRIPSSASVAHYFDVVYRNGLFTSEVDMITRSSPTASVSSAVDISPSTSTSTSKTMMRGMCVGVCVFIYVC
jgi:hypothetical protein